MATEITLTIDAISPKARAIRENGDWYHVPHSIDFALFQARHRCTIRYEEQNHERHVTEFVSTTPLRRAPYTPPKTTGAVSVTIAQTPSLPVLPRFSEKRTIQLPSTSPAAAPSPEVLAAPELSSVQMLRETALKAAAGIYSSGNLSALKLPKTVDGIFELADKLFEYLTKPEQASSTDV